MHTIRSTGETALRTATAALAYGYYLGNPDGWDVEEANQFGALNLDWYCDIGYQESSCGDFIVAARQHLKAQGMENGIDFHVFGKLMPGSVDMYVLLAAKGSYSSTENWGDSLSVTPNGLLLPELLEWDSTLAEALHVLGLTPYQEEPRWQILPSLG